MLVRWPDEYFGQRLKFGPERTVAGMAAVRLAAKRLTELAQMVATAKVGIAVGVVVAWAAMQQAAMD